MSIFHGLLLLSPVISAAELHSVRWVGPGRMLPARSYYAVLVGRSNGDGAWRGLVTIVEVIDPRPYIFQVAVYGNLIYEYTVIYMSDRLLTPAIQIPVCPCHPICVVRCHSTQETEDRNALVDVAGYVCPSLECHVTGRQSSQVKTRGNKIRWSTWWAVSGRPYRWGLVSDSLRVTSTEPPSTARCHWLPHVSMVSSHGGAQYGGR